MRWKKSMRMGRGRRESEYLEGKLNKRIWNMRDRMERLRERESREWK